MPVRWPRVIGGYHCYQINRNQGKQLTGVDFYTAGLSQGTLLRANLTGVRLFMLKVTGVDLTEANSEGAGDLNMLQSEGAIFCKTIMPDGSENNSGC